MRGGEEESAPSFQLDPTWSAEVDALMGLTRMAVNRLRGSAARSETCGRRDCRHDARLRWCSCAPPCDRRYRRQSWRHVSPALRNTWQSELPMRPHRKLRKPPQ